MTISLRANNDGSAVILVQGQPRITLDPSGNIVGIATPPYSDSSQKLANTEFVLSRGRSFKTASILTSSYTMVAADVGKEFTANAETGSVNITLPPLTSVSPGAVVRVNAGSLSGSNRVNIRPSGSDVIFGSSSANWANSNPVPLGSGEWAEIVHNGNVWQLIDGPILLDLNGATFQGLNGSPGWRRLAGGTVLQWGLSPVVSPTSTGSVPFTVPFVYGAYSVMATFADSAAPTRSINTNINSISLTNFGIRNPDTIPSQFRWMAIGA